MLSLAGLRKHPVLLAGATHPELLARLERFFDVELAGDADVLDAGLLRERLAGKSALVASRTAVIDASLLTALPHLKAVCRIGASHDEIDLAACTRAGVIATNTAELGRDEAACRRMALAAADNLIAVFGFGRAGGHPANLLNIECAARSAAACDLRRSPGRATTPRVAACLLTVGRDTSILERGSTSVALVYSPASRCFDIVELLAAEPAGMPLTGVGRSLGLPKSATHRLLLTLIECGYAAQDPVTQRYRLTFKIATVAFRLLASSTLQDVAQPVLDRLARASGDLARLAVVDGDGMRWVAKAQGAQAGLRYDPEMGLEVALNATGVGRLWLASLPEPQALAILDRYETRARRALGPNAPRSRGAWLAKMREVRRRSYAEAMEEGAAGVGAVGAAIRVGHGDAATVVGTVSITGPVSRFGAKRRPMLGRLCVDAAAELAELWPVRADEQPVLATADAA